MNIVVEKQPKCIASLSAEIPADVVNSERSKITSDFSKQAKIPGFRPGKAPAKVIQKRYQKEISGELNQRLIRLACDEAIKKEDLKVMNAQQNDAPVFEEDGACKFTTRLILQPEFDLPEYKGLEIQSESAEVTDKDVENGLLQLRERMADYSDITDRALEKDDLAVITYSTTLDGKEIEEAVGKSVGFLSGREGFWIKAQEDAFLPGFCDQILGMNQGETKEVTVTIADDFPVSELHGKEVVIAVTLDAIKLQTLPELNDEFANKVAEGKNLEELTELLKENIANDKQRHVGDQKVQQIVDHLLGSMEFDVPQDLLNQEIQGTADQMVARATQQGLSEEQITAQKDEIQQSATQQAEKNLKTNFILQKIAQEEKIEINQQDMIQRIVAMAQQQGKEPQALAKEIEKANAMQQVQNSVLIGKTIDFLVSEAKVEAIEADDASDSSDSNE